MGCDLIDLFYLPGIARIRRVPAGQLRAGEQNGGRAQDRSGARGSRLGREPAEHAAHAKKSKRIGRASATPTYSGPATPRTANRPAAPRNMSAGRNRRSRILRRSAARIMSAKPATARASRTVSWSPYPAAKVIPKRVRRRTKRVGEGGARHRAVRADLPGQKRDGRGYGCGDYQRSPQCQAARRPVSKHFECGASGDHNSQRAEGDRIGGERRKVQERERRQDRFGGPSPQPEVNPNPEKEQQRAVQEIPKSHVKEIVACEGQVQYGEGAGAFRKRLEGEPDGEGKQQDVQSQDPPFGGDRIGHADQHRAQRLGKSIARGIPVDH
jgi:hypothetical protein